MKILSKYRDYYDIGLSYGIDNEVVFERYSKTFETKLLNRYRIKKLSFCNDKNEIKIYYNYIVFCEELHPFIKIEEIEFKIENKEKVINDVKKEFLYSANEVNKYFENLFFRYKIKYYESSYSKELISEFFNEKREDILEFFINTNSFYCLFEQYIYLGEREFKYTGYKCVTHPILKEYKFIKLLEPLKAYQKLFMYISAKKSKEENKKFEIEDKYKIQSKGFDKYSFRKQ